MKAKRKKRRKLKLENWNYNCPKFSSVQGLLADYKSLTDQEKEIRAALSKVRAAGEVELEEQLPGLKDGEEAEPIGSVPKWKLSNLTKLRKFSKGENFSIFCDRVIQFVQIANMKSANLHMFCFKIWMIRRIPF